MHLFLIRHGETAWNNERRIQGNPDTPLNPNGIAQARQLARRIADEKLDALYASPHPRVKLLNDTCHLQNGRHLGETSKDSYGEI